MVVPFWVVCGCLKDIGIRSDISSKSKLPLLSYLSSLWINSLYLPRWPAFSSLVNRLLAFCIRLCLSRDKLNVFSLHAEMLSPSVSLYILLFLLHDKISVSLHSLLFIVSFFMYNFLPISKWFFYAFSSYLIFLNTRYPFSIIKISTRNLHRKLFFKSYFHEFPLQDYFCQFWFSRSGILSFKHINCGLKHIYVPLKILDNCDSPGN